MNKIRTWAKANPNRVWAWLIGAGLVLFAVHSPNQPLKEYIFLPTLGLIISLLAVSMILLDNRKNLTLGSRWVYIPMLVIIASMLISGLINGEILGAKFAPFLFGLYLFGIYIVARILKNDLFPPFTVAAIVCAIGCIAYRIGGYGNEPTGGITSATNYDIAAGLMVIGTVVSASKHRWWLSGIMLIGLFVCGAPEGVIGMGALAITVLIKRDWGKKLLLPVGVIVLGLIVLLTTSTGNKLLNYTLWIVSPNIAEYPFKQATETVIERENPLVGRVRVANEAMSDIKPFGHGYSITEFSIETVHNVPLIIVDQIGILAALAWLAILGYCLIKTKWRYAFIAILAMSIFDHYIWTQVAPWWWAIAGVSTVDTKHNDYIFKKVQ